MSTIGNNITSEGIALAEIISFIPPWTKTISCVPKWKSVFKEGLPPPHIEFKDYNISDISNGGHYDIVYLSPSELPSSAQDFISLFNSLSPGGIAILESKPKTWSRLEMLRIADSVGGKLHLFASLRNNGLLAKSSNKLVVIQKKVFSNIRKKLTVIVPILSANRDNQRVLEWLRFFHNADILPFVELMVIFDGIHDALPDWQEYDGLDLEHGFQMIRHYRSFGKHECLRTGLYFARGNYLFWDNYPIPCEELFCLLAHLPNHRLCSPVAVFTNAVSSDATSGKRTAFSPSPIPFFLLNRSAAKLLYNENSLKYECNLESVQTILKRHKVDTAFATVRC